MRLKITLLTFVFLLLSNIFASCCDKLDYMKFNKMVLKSFEKNNGIYYEIAEGKEIHALNYGLLISFDLTYYSTMNSLANNLYATEPCNDGEKGSKEIIAEMSIVSSADIDEFYKAGTELRECFKYKQEVFFSNHNSKDTSLKKIDNNYYELVQKGYWQIIVLDKEVLKDSIHKFTVKIKLSDGREYKEDTFQIKFK